MMIEVLVAKAYEINNLIQNPEMMLYDLFMVPIQNKE